MVTVTALIILLTEHPKVLKFGCIYKHISSPANVHVYPTIAKTLFYFVLTFLMLITVKIIAVEWFLSYIIIYKLTRKNYNHRTYYLSLKCNKDLYAY
jgi:hypothetical protein